MKKSFTLREEIDKAKTWLFRILHRVFLSRYRRRRHELPPVDIEELSYREIAPRAAIFSRSFGTRLCAAF